MSSALRIGALLARIGFAVREHLRRYRHSQSAMATAVGYEGGDTIFAIDRMVEPVVRRALAKWPADLLPLALTAEGMGPDGKCRIGAAQCAPRWHLLIDPIDGTRSLMYDKRSAWFLATAVPAGNSPPTLSRAVAAAMVELPTSRQCEADHFVAESDGSVVAARLDLSSGRSRPLTLRGSGERTLLHGFGQVSSFFPGTHALAGQLMDAIAQVAAPHPPGGAAIFNDQYISTGGQLCELMLGRDRFCCDLRPLFHRIAQRDRGMSPGPQPLACHPYDLAGFLLARRAGIILTDGFGRDLDAPFDVHTRVHWVGYANAALRALIEPVIHGWLLRCGVTPD